MIKKPQSGFGSFLMAQRVEQIRENRLRRLKYWLFIQVALPLLFLIAGVWIMFKMRQPVHAFEKTLASGDMLLLGALLLLGIMVDIFYELTSRRVLLSPARIDNHFLVSFILGLVFIVLYMVVRDKMMDYDFHSDPVPTEISQCIWLSFFGGLFAILWSVLINTVLTKQMIEIEREHENRSKSRP